MGIYTYKEENFGCYSRYRNGEKQGDIITNPEYHLISRIKAIEETIQEMEMSNEDRVKLNNLCDLSK
jgi:hypothetical protein